MTTTHEPGSPATGSQDDGPATKRPTSPGPRKPAAGNLTIAIYLVITGLSAACGLVIEIVAGRIIAPYLGMSLYTWTAIIAVVLAGFSAGHWVGGWLAEKPPGQAGRAVAFALFLAGLTAAMSLVLLRTLSGPILSMGFSPVPTILLLTFALFFPPSFFVGIPSPALTKLAIDEAPHRMGTLLGAFYAVGAFGSIIGTLAAGYIFISYFGSIRTILTVAFLYLAMAAVLFIQDRRREDRPLASTGTVLPLILAGFVFSGALLWGRGVLAFVENCTRESAYYCIRVIDISNDVGLPARTMVLDNLGHGINLRDQPGIFLTPYVEAQDNLVRLRFSDRQDLATFFIGGGAYTLPRAWNARWPDSRTVVAEVDPEVTASARDSFWLQDNERLIITHQDARRALSQAAANSFDVIVGDAFHDIAVPQHLVTQEFFALVASRLQEGGIYLMNVVDAGNHPRLALSIMETLKTTFPVVEIWQPRGQGDRQTFVIVAGNSPTPAGSLQSRVDAQSQWVRWPTEAIADVSAATKPLVLTDDYAPVDRLIGVQ